MIPDDTPATNPATTPAIDLLRKQRAFLAATVARPTSTLAWHTPNRVVLEHAAYRLRRFVAPAADGAAADGATTDAAPPGDGARLPLLVVPPEVNRSQIADFGPGQSLVRAALDAGFADVAVLEWRSASARTATRDVDDSLGSILDAAEHLGGDHATPVHVVGLCQGGWEAAMVAALHPTRVASLTLAAAPIDFRAGHGALRPLVDAMPQAAYAGLVASGGGLLRGELLSMGFDNLQPLQRHGVRWLSLWNHLDDEPWLERFHRLNDWYRAPKDLPGPMYLRAVRELFKENRLIQGRFVALGRRVELSAIRCPLALVMGTRDHITPPEQTRAAAGAVSSEAVLEVEVPAGHVGTFMGRAAIRDHWPQVFAWLRARVH